MSEIDWSKAPEGATHFGEQRDGFIEAWYKLDSDGLKFKWADVAEMEWRCGPTRHINDLVPRPSQAWNGEGLPPVGTVCEY